MLKHFNLILAWDKDPLFLGVISNDSTEGGGIKPNSDVELNP